MKIIKLNNLEIKVDDDIYNKFKNKLYSIYHNKRKKHYIYIKNTNLSLSKYILKTDKRINYKDKNTLNLTRDNIFLHTEETLRQAKKLWQEKNKKHILNKSKQWRLNNLERYNLNQKKYRDRNKEKIKIRRNKYLKTSRAKNRISYNYFLLQRKLHYKFKRLLTRTKKLNKPCYITKKQYYKKIKKGCYYCGKSLTDELGYCLDRLDNKKGYYNNNTVGCCKYCNRLKNNMLTVKETKVLIKTLKKLRKTELIWENQLVKDYSWFMKKYKIHKENGKFIKKGRQNG